MTKWRSWVRAIMAMASLAHVGDDQVEVVGEGDHGHDFPGTCWR